MYTVRTSPPVPLRCGAVTGRYIAPEISRALVQALPHRREFGWPDPFWVIGATPGSEQWPISVYITITRPVWSTPRTFEVPFTVGDFAADDTGAIPAAEVGAGLATHALVLIEELLRTGPVPGIKEVTS